jgi:hypothetical protein
MKNFKIFLLLITLGFCPLLSHSQNSEELNLVSKFNPQQVAENILRPVMGEWYDSFRHHYKFIHWINMKIELPPVQSELQNYNELKVYASLVKSETLLLDSFISQISQSLNIDPKMIVLAFGLNTSGSLVYDKRENEMNELTIPAKYWYRFPDYRLNVNDFYDIRPPPILFGKFYPQFISDLNSRKFPSRVLAQAYVVGAPLVKERELERQRLAQAEAEQAKRQEQERLAKAREDAAKNEAERIEVKRRADEKAAQEAAQEAAARAAKEALARKRMESEKWVRAKREGLKNSGIYETDVISLIANFESYKGKIVFLKCWINRVNPRGGDCRSGDDRQYISFENEGINKQDFKWLLQNCSNQFYRDNDWYCQSAPIVGTVGGTSEPRLKNVYVYELCKKRDSPWSRELEGCSLD